VERAVLLADEDQLGPRDFPALGAGRLRLETPAGCRLPPSGLDIHELERSLVEQALGQTGGNQTRAGELLGLNRDQIRYRIEKFKLAKHPAAGDASD
jgi:DNA-binding NtrC family response regulator